MTNEEILTKVVEKAFSGGWRFDFRKDINLADVYNFLFDRYEGCKPEEYIYTHDFAKSFWKEEDMVQIRHIGDLYGMSIVSELKPWQVHLQQMVISEDPIKYLEQFI